MRTGGGRNDKSARTHTERIHTATVNLCDETVLGSRQILSPTVLIVILYAVYKCRRMLQTHPYGYALRLHLYACPVEIAVDIARGVTRGKNHRTSESELSACSQVYCLNPVHCVTAYEKTGHLCAEVHFSATSEYGVAHVLYHARQLVGANVRMGVREYRR